MATVIVDSGYSFTHAVPIFDRCKINYAVKRLDVGGKILTNYLKELVTYREFNMMGEAHLIDQLKRLLCFVSSDFEFDMSIARQRGESNFVRREFVNINPTTMVLNLRKIVSGGCVCSCQVLPDYRANNYGYVRNPQWKWDAQVDMPPGDQSHAWRDSRAMQPDADLRGPEQLLSLNNERFTVPELLFNPSVRVTLACIMPWMSLRYGVVGYRDGARWYCGGY